MSRLTASETEGEDLWARSLVCYQICGKRALA